MRHFRLDHSGRNIQAGALPTDHLGNLGWNIVARRAFDLADVAGDAQQCRGAAGERGRYLHGAGDLGANHLFISTGTSLTDGITGTGAADPLTWVRLARCPC